jgi:hypothetical protein
MAEASSFTDVTARRLAGDEGAAGAAFERFTRRQVGPSRSRLDTWVRRKEDPADMALAPAYRGWDGL